MTSPDLDATTQPWLSADELEQLARARLTPAVYDYIAGGSGGELTLAENRAAFERLRLRPRVMTGAGPASTQAELFGKRLSAPIFVAPMGEPSHLLVHPHGVEAAAAGAADAGLGYMLSASSTKKLELPGDALVCQVYLNDRDSVAALVRGAERGGFIAVCLTVDVPVTALRRRNLRHGTGVPTPGGESVKAGFANHAAYARPTTWSDIGWLRSQTDLPVLVKGVMTAEDAQLAVEAGAGGIVVSNHGGRQLDGTLGTIDVLPEVVQAVDRRIPVLLDGGVRSATDVALALALGASAVGIGKGVMWALAAGGRRAVAGYLGSLTADLARTMAMLGVDNVGDLSPEHVDRRFQKGR
jgi:isopentenyl diphosphate isomerase/L-lactate dehydrogenase-like FMN-dependent dehydrogenase